MAYFGPLETKILLSLEIGVSPASSVIKKTHINENITNSEGSVYLFLSCNTPAAWHIVADYDVYKIEGFTTTLPR